VQVCFQFCGNAIYLVIMRDSPGTPTNGRCSLSIAACENRLFDPGVRVIAVCVQCLPLSGLARQSSDCCSRNWNSTTTRCVQVGYCKCPGIDRTVESVLPTALCIAWVAVPSLGVPSTAHQEVADLYSP
jgi:hypothetical protein